MADLTVPLITLGPRVPKGPKAITVTTNAGVTVFITDEVTLWHNFTETVSVLDTSFIHVTHTITNISTTTQPTTITHAQMQTITTSTALDSNSSTTTLPPLPTTTYDFCSPVPTKASVAKHVDPFQVLSIMFGVFILFLLALMWFLVRRFYKMYRAERVLRKQLQTEGTEMPAMGKEMGMVGGEGGEE